MILQSLMESYLNNNIKYVYPVSKDDGVPLTPAKKEWVVFEKTLKRVFEFETRKQKEAFVLEILKYDRDADAVVEMRVKKEKVAIIIHAVSPSISEIEVETKAEIDKIRKDVVYYYAKKL